MGKLPRSKMTGTSYPVVADLPTGVYEGIGSVVQAHAILETALQELLFAVAPLEFLDQPQAAPLCGALSSEYAP